MLLNTSVKGSLGLPLRWNDISEKYKFPERKIVLGKEKNVSWNMWILPKDIDSVS